MPGSFEDSNNISIGIHFFKVLVQIHYSRSPLPRAAEMLIYIFITPLLRAVRPLTNKTIEPAGLNSIGGQGGKAPL